MKKLIKIAVALVLLLVVGVVVAFVYMDSIATTAVQKAAAYATQCEVTVGKVDVKPISGKVSISQLDIKNPTTDTIDFREIQDSFLTLETGSAEVSLGTLRSNPVEVSSVRTSQAVITLVGRDGQTNYETILESLNRLKGEDAPATTEEDARQFILQLIEVTEAKVIVDMDEDPALGLMAVDLELDLKPITLTDVGSGGVPLSQVSADMIADILVQVVAQLGEQLGDRVLSGLTSGLSGLLGPEALQQRLTDITSTLGLDSIDVGDQLARASELGTAVFEGASEIIGGATEGLGDVIDGAGGLLGGEDDEEGQSGGGLLDRGRGLLGGDE